MNDGNETVTIAPKTPIPIRRLAPGQHLTVPHMVTPAKNPPQEVHSDNMSVSSTLTEDKDGNLLMDDGSISTLGSVDTTGTINMGQASSTFRIKFLRSKQKIKQEMKEQALEHHQMQQDLKAQVAALEAQLANQLIPGTSTAPAGPKENG